MNSPWRNVDIAIIGLSCRFPGATTAEEYWTNLCQGVESVTFFSDHQLVAAGVDPSLLANPNYVKAAPILRDIEMFDASFFGYSPKDAALMDPQQRLFLEVCWETFENAGYDPAAYPGKVGVFSSAGGIVTSYLLTKLHHANLVGQTASTSHINNDKDFLSTRVSFKLNLRGPSFTIQSACSSSLVAVHQACQSLRFGECDMMLVGGSAVRVPQVDGYLAEKRNLYSLDGHCRPFDSAGQGTIFGSGVGAVLLKPLKQAVADRDHIFAVIKGTAANNDGSAKISYTAPSLGQQSQAVDDALKSAGVSADSVGYIECHSTGTIVGDPLEIEALTTAFRKDTKRKQYCAIGSVKANIGHPEQAAGIAGLIKTALVLHHKQIPPSINFETPNPRIDFESSPFYVNTKLRDFPLADTPRRAGLNSLGIGGTNTFVVLEEAPHAAARDQSPELFPCLATLSAKSADALVARVEQLLNCLNDNPDVSIGDLCYTSNVSRSQFAFRFAAPARSVAELKKHLAAWLRMVAEDASSLQRTSNAPIAFLFSGQGPQYPGMAAELYRRQSVFRNAIDRCHALASPHLEQGLLDVIFSGDGDNALVNRTDYTQPALFAVEYALAELVKSWGIAPNAVIGHSLGEFAAACAADVIALEDAMRLVIARGVLMHRLPSGGGMTAIFAEESVVRGLIDKIAPGITVAAMNGPMNTVVSGERDALRKLSQELDRRDITYRELHISNGFHSPRTEPILDEMEKVAGEIKYNAPKLPLISNLTGELMSAAPDKSYWRRHLREAVRFEGGMHALAQLGCRAFIEIGPHPVLLPLAQACLGAKGRSAVWIATLNRQKSDAGSLSEMLATLYLAGHSVNWNAVHADSSWQRIPMPTYPFQRERHWIENDTVRAEEVRTPIKRMHPLVGARINSIAEDVRYEARYAVRRAGYLSDHRVLGTVVLPTTAELEAATVVGRMHFGTPGISFENAMHHQAMSFADGEDRIVRLVVTPLKSERASFKLLSAAAQDPEVWHTHMTGTLRRSEEPLPRADFSTKQIRARCRQTLPVGDFYDRLKKLGLEYGPGFRGVRELHLGQHELLTKVRLPDNLADTQYVIHPAFLDACLHAYPLALDGAETAKSDRRNSYLPVSLEAFRCYQDGIDKAWVHTRLRSVGKDDTQVVDIRIYDDAERPVADLEGLTVRLLPLAKVQMPRTDMDDLFYRVAWRKSPGRTIDPAQDCAPASWMIFADANGVGVALAKRLEASGHHCHLVYRDSAFAQRGARTWTVNERQPQDFRRLLEQFLAGEMLPCEGLIYMWALDAPPVADLTLAKLKSASEMMCRGGLGALHALAESRSTKPSGRRLWFVTASAQKTENEDQEVDPVQAPLWGLGRTAAIEYPAIWGGLIDLRLNCEVAPDDIEFLAAELLHPDGETQIAISTGGRRSIPRLVRQSLAELPAQSPRVRSDATYLVTGGLGMLGRSISKWLISHGAKHLVLTGRNASSEAAQEIFSAAEINGAAIHVVPADIGRAEDVSRLVRTIGSEFPPLKGVVHSAGILDDGILAQLDWDRFARVFESKVYGSWLLHECTRSLDLDFFLLQSSLLSLLGSAGQGNYSAGNTFLDSLAAYRRAAGQPATVVNWPAWSGGGLATVSGARGEAMWSSLGVKFVSPDLAMLAFDKLMQRDVEQIAIAVADWPTYAGKVGKPPLLRQLLAGNEEDFRSPKPEQRSDAQAARPVRANDEARQELSSRLQQRIMAELGFVDPIDPDQPLNEVGLDSLRSVALANNLEDEFGILVSISQLISGPTINQLVNHLSDLLPHKARGKVVEPDLVVTSAAAVKTLSGRPFKNFANGDSSAAAHGFLRLQAADGQNGNDQFSGKVLQQQLANRYAPEETTVNDGTLDYSDVGINEKTPLEKRWGEGAWAGNSGADIAHSAGAVESRSAGKWLIAPRPNPDAKVRLFCFPYAGGGLVSFRVWAKQFNGAVEVVAVEAPGRGTRINETPVDDLNTFVAGLLPEMVDLLDRPSAFFGHCLGGLTMFATLHALPEACKPFIKYVFACGVRPPHLLKRRGEFEDNLVYDMMLHREFDIRVPPYAQTDEIFADIIRQFDTPAANKMLEIPKLREVLLPTIRAEFCMAYNYKYRPVEPLSFPISSFVGDADPWVSEEDSAGWGELTRGRFTNHLRKGSHFLMADDGKYIIETINSEFVNSVI
jgi:acyl transferase domain-containing protein/surfactin synthase thioesterase subunit